MPLGRLRAAPRALTLARRIASSRRLEKSALGRAGEAVARTWATVDPAPAAVARAVEAGDRITALDAALADSLEHDRADYGSVSTWVRPFVITRGLAARLVLRHQRRTASRLVEVAWTDLGRATLDGTAGLPAAAVPHVLDEAVATVRAEIAAAEHERAELLAPFGGALVPHGLAVVAVEGAAFARAIWGQFRAQFFPRLPALAGLAAGWWIAHVYIDSPWRATLNRLGFGDGGTLVVSPETYARIRFWLPLLAAAVCAYASNRLAAFVRRRYATGVQGGVLAPADPRGAPLGTPPAA